MALVFGGCCAALRRQASSHRVGGAAEAFVSCLRAARLAPYKMRQPELHGVLEALQPTVIAAFNTNTTIKPTTATMD